MCLKSIAHMIESRHRTARAAFVGMEFRGERLVTNVNELQCKPTLGVALLGSLELGVAESLDINATKNLLDRLVPRLCRYGRCLVTAMTRCFREIIET